MLATGAWAPDVPGSFSNLAGILLAPDVAGAQAPRQHYVFDPGHIGAQVVEVVTGPAVALSLPARVATPGVALEEKGEV